MEKSFLFSTFFLGKFVCRAFLVCGKKNLFPWKIMSVMFLLVEHYKFVNLFMRHRTVSTGQIIFEFFSTGHCAVSHKQKCDK
jgi:hypothetical protein